jgi:hypothetical protein
MMLTDAIREANSEHAVYFLLTGYVETLQFSKILPDRLVELPLEGLRDLRLRLERLVAHFETTIRLMDNAACDVIGEAIQVFDAALRRLNRLHGEQLKVWQPHPWAESPLDRSHA